MFKGPSKTSHFSKTDEEGGQKILLLHLRMTPYHVKERTQKSSILCSKPQYIIGLVKTFKDC